MADDGALYSEDGTTLIKCETPCETFSVRDGCRTIGYKAFMYQSGLKHVELPPSVEELDSFAFACTSLESFKAPPHLNHIGEKAFFQCADLHQVTLNEGLLSIGDEAFARTDIGFIGVPATTKHVGHGTIAGTPLEHQASCQTLDVSSDNQTLTVDDEGGLYRRVDNEVVLIGMLSDTTTHHHVLEGTTAIGSEAYARAYAIEEIDLPEGVRVIGKGAMRHCVNLRRVSIPKTLERIDNEAFYQSSLENIYLPASLHFLGSRALATGIDGEATLQRVVVDPASKRFYTTSGLLCERARGGRSFVVLYFGPDSKVVIPPEAISIGPNAFMCSKRIDELHVHAGVESVHPLAFSSRCRINGLISMELKEEVCGQRYLNVWFSDPVAPNAIWGLRSSAISKGLVDPETLCEYYDQAILLMHSVYERARRIIERLAVPQFLNDERRQSFCDYLSRTLESTCRAFAERGYAEGFEYLVRFNILNRDNISQIIDCMGEMGDAAVTGYLLELKRSRFGGSRTNLHL